MKSSFLLWHKLGIKIRHILDPLTLNLILNKLKTSVDIHEYIHTQEWERNGNFFFKSPLKVIMWLVMKRIRRFESCSGRLKKLPFSTSETQLYKHMHTCMQCRHVHELKAGAHKVHLKVITVQNKIHDSYCHFTFLLPHSLPFSPPPHPVPPITTVPASVGSAPTKVHLRHLEALSS